MIQIPDEIKKQLLSNTISRRVSIKFPDAGENELKEITDKNIVSESFELKHSICDGDFMLGGCIAGQMTIQVIDIEEQLNNKRIEVYIAQTYGKNLYPSDTLKPSNTLYPAQNGTVRFLIFTGVIDSSLRQKNRAVKEIIAYDDIYRFSQCCCGNSFKGYAQIMLNPKLIDIRDAAVDWFIQRAEREIEVSDFAGFNDSKVLSFDYDAVESVVKSNLTVSELLSAYAELNSCFCTIDRYGRIAFIALYKKDDEVTAQKAVDEIITEYSDLSFEEYTTAPINLIEFQCNKNQTFAYGHGAEKQSWYVSDNLITSCCSYDGAGELVTAFNNNTGENYLFGNLYSYRPFSADVFGRWWLEPGDRIQIKTGYDDTEIVDSFIFSRTIKGISGMKVSIEAKGTEFLGKDEISKNE